MTPRKPPNVSVRSFVERQVRDAQIEGAFENLPGAGKPIPGIDRPRDELDWLVNYLRRENTDLRSVLPPSLAIAKEVEDLDVRLAGERRELRVREILDELNGRIDRAHAAPQIGPPFRVKRVDADAAVTRWREARATLQPAPAPVVAAAEPDARRRWWRRGR